MLLLLPLLLLLLVLLIQLLLLLLLLQLYDDEVAIAAIPTICNIQMMMVVAMVREEW